MTHPHKLWKSGVWLAVTCLLIGTPVYAATPNAARMFGNAIADTVEKVMPSVVVIRTESRQFRLMQDWMFGRTYRIPERLAGLGSGVIINREGYILTNNHVIDGATEISVVLNDGGKYAAELVGSDPHTDLAVIRLLSTDGLNLTPIEPGDSDALRVGEFVIALGSPFSLASSVTLGIVSQKGRSIGLLPFEDFIQTDAAINQGNSGGPLVDVDGRMVGINTVIQTAGYSSGNIGISFAVPVNLAMRVADSLINSGRWERPWLGIWMNETEGGVLIMEVVEDSPASHGGLEIGDIIIEVDGDPVSTSRDVQRQVLDRDVGETAEVTILRNGERVILKIVTAMMPSMRALPYDR